MTSSEGRERQRFTIDLPDQEAALALAGQGEIMLRRLSDLTGANLVLRGLQLFIEGRPSQMERAAGLVELLRPFWSEGLQAGLDVHLGDGLALTPKRA